MKLLQDVIHRAGRKIVTVPVLRHFLNPNEAAGMREAERGWEGRPPIDVGLGGSPSTPPLSGTVMQREQRLTLETQQPCDDMGGAGG